MLNICNVLGITPNTLFVDSFKTDDNISDNIIPIQKHDIILKYAKLTNANQEFIDSTIEHIYNEQTRKN